MIGESLTYKHVNLVDKFLSTSMPNSENALFTSCDKTEGKQH